MTQRSRLLLLPLALLGLAVVGIGALELALRRSSTISASGDTSKIHSAPDDPTRPAPERGRKALAAGASFGKGKDGRACLDEAFLRLNALCDLDVTCNVIEQFFLEGCLPASTTAAGFCEGVPPRSEEVRSISWSVARCSTEHQQVEQGCPRVLKALQDFCNGGPPPMR